MPSMPSDISQRLTAVKQAIATACQSANRPIESVQLIAVSKTYPAAAVAEAYAAGQRHFGENRVQEMVIKHQEMVELGHSGILWHQIGPLQTNKVKYIAPFVHLIHTLDEIKLLQIIDKEAQKCQRVIDCLIQINISNEQQKNGASVDEATELLEVMSKYPHVRILGLMGIAQDTDDTAIISQQFESLAQALAAFKRYENTQINLHHLSMGMSGDYALAILAGATMVRMGSAIFGPRNSPQG
jgi:PLP dependent protein